MLAGNSSSFFFLTLPVCAIELLELPNDIPIATLSGGVTVTPLSSSALISEVESAQSIVLVSACWSCGA